MSERLPDLPVIEDADDDEEPMIEEPPTERTDVPPDRLPK